MTFRVRIAISVASLLASGTVMADSMRCGSVIVNETASIAELLQKCGEPVSKDIRTEDVYARNPDGFTYKTGTRTIERWIYQRSSQALPMAVTIIDGKVSRLERAE